MKDVDRAIKVIEEMSEEWAAAFEGGDENRQMWALSCIDVMHERAMDDPEFAARLAAIHRMPREQWSEAMIKEVPPEQEIDPHVS